MSPLTKPAITKVHHLDCATMCPRRPINDGPDIPGHVLLLETAMSGLVLIDTGIGTQARQDGKAQLGGLFMSMTRPITDLESTALRQIQSLGFSGSDVQHILITHLDPDHAGGLSDFPDATIHLHADELAAARKPTIRERSRYRKPLWAHNPNWATFGSDGERWNGFDAARQLPGLPDNVVALPLPGHTRGHAAFAVVSDDRTLVHAGDAYFHRGSVNGTKIHSGSKMMEAINAVDRKAVAANHEKLAELVRHAKATAPANVSGSNLQVFCSHDPVEFARLASTQA
jgi:glyoxylase-like metal-dependent hydrolase (beta-lactamase superfamily II)